MTVFLAYIILFVLAYVVVNFVRARREAVHDFTSLKTVTFGDESAVRPDRAASIISILVIFIIWGAFTGSKITPIHVPGPFEGVTSFTYTATNAAGEADDATVYVLVFPLGTEPELENVEPGDGFAVADSLGVTALRTERLRILENDTGEDLKITAINGQPVTPGEPIAVDNGEILINPRGALLFTPDKGWQMEPIWLPPPEGVLERLVEIARDGYQNFTLWEHLGFSLMRVIVGFVLGSLVGIPLGYAMGLSGWFRGWFDPIVEFMRPVPPLALIPLVIIWFGIWETGKIILLFLAALWIMTIAARAGVSGVNISKIHAAYSLGASRWQIMRHVIVPNSLPEIFTGARVAMGVCWGTVVAAELVAAQKGAGMMIIAASKFQLTDIVIMGIILIGIIGYGIDILMRMAERWLVPWKGRH